MSALVAAVALPVAALVIAGLLRADLGGRLVAAPTGERWHERPTPSFGGVGIFAGLCAGVGLAIAVGAVDASSELLGILGGCAILFVAGLLDDAYTLRPLAKLAAQFAAAGVVLAAGLSVEIVGNDALALAIGLLWLVGITNAFNLLDNMDGLAASLAAISCGVFAVHAVALENQNEIVLPLAIALGCACAAFLPFNLRADRPAAVFMGDSGSQVIGFGLASLALASSWTAAGATLAGVLLPLLVLAVPILDTTLVTIRRTRERRPVTQGGRDHSSHRLVYYGLTERQAVALLAVLAALLGLTGLAYNALDNGRVTTFGVLVTFVVLVQFASFLGDLEDRSRRADPGPPPSLLRAFFSQPRRLIEVLVDFALICASFLVSYLLFVDGKGTEVERAIFLSALPVLLGVRYVAFVLFGIYRRIWRFATPRDAIAIGVATTVATPVAVAIVAKSRSLSGFPLEIFVVDALLCTLLVSASRLVLRLAPDLVAASHRGPRTRTLIVGAGRSGRRLARELREARGTRVVGFLDDNPSVRRRRVLGVKVLGGLDETEALLAVARPDEVLVTIPDVEPARLNVVLASCAAAEIPCRLVRSHTEITRSPLVEIRAE